MKKFTILFYLLSLSFANSQSDKNVEENQVQIGLPMPAVLYEKGIGKNATLSLEALTGLQIRGCSGCETQFGVHPILRGQYRYYYNMERRIRKGKNITGNSGNYVGGLLVYQSGAPLIGDIQNSDILGGGPVYGIQRTYKRGFFYRLEGGVAYLEDDFNKGIGLILAARIGWVLRKRR
ncbi:hypothetical protein FEE95_00745 [Maribacter algarum]|uniref:DUF3575 domain-containing protein n=1 Tax=Maribacter algarum (ex Zhang et al. 2020) TaxID=2578118 RepID=A0A5S3PXJ4_9FLAO|nr:hypothetical protein [Maribacter algarum]TMM57987.1 hypothetical protein FEE95_00745 [Maribacter algarum]